jgi:hypothetical protein
VVLVVLALEEAVQVGLLLKQAMVVELGTEIRAEMLRALAGVELVVAVVRVPLVQMVKEMVSLLENLREMAVLD